MFIPVDDHFLLLKDKPFPFSCLPVIIRPFNLDDSHFALSKSQNSVLSCERPELSLPKHAIAVYEVDVRGCLHT